MVCLSLSVCVCDTYLLVRRTLLIKAVSSAAFLNSTYQALPDFLTATEYKDPTDPTNTAVQQAVGEDAKGKNLLEILMARPDAARGFGILITTCGKDNSLIQDLYPVKERLAVRFGRDKFGLDDWQSPSKEDKKEDKDADAEAVMFVDVGGCYGQRTIALKRSLPDLPGRFIVQDLPDTIENAPPAMAAEASKLGIELMPHDFFTSQPVRGARAYYIRQCLHNWPDEDCVTILTYLRRAMTPEYSRLLVHELIVPPLGAGTWMATQDFNMMALCGTRQRTEDQWRRLLAEAGLRVTGVYFPKDGQSEGVIEAEVA